MDFEFNEDGFRDLERQLTEALMDFPVPDGPEDEAAVSVQAEMKRRAGLDIDHEGALEIVRKARAQEGK